MFPVGHMKSLGELFLAFLTEEYVFRHGGSPGKHHNAISGVRIGIQFSFSCGIWHQSAGSPSVVR